MNDFFEAKDTILCAADLLDNGRGHGIVILLYGLQDPGADAMLELLQALRVVFRAWHGHKIMDREVASALWGIAHSLEFVLNNNTPNFGRECLREEAASLIAAIDSVFEDSWQPQRLLGECDEASSSLDF